MVPVPRRALACANATQGHIRFPVAATPAPTCGNPCLLSVSIRLRLILAHPSHPAGPPPAFDSTPRGEAEAMPYATTSLRAEKRALRDKMRSMGLDHGR